MQSNLEQMPLTRESLKHLSFEFFPPRTSREQHNLLRTARRLAEFEPDFYSVTHGAGGSTRSGTLETVRVLRANGFNAIPHLSWGTDSEVAITDLLHEYTKLDVDRLVVLRGDIPGDEPAPSEMRYAAELVRLVRDKFADAFTLHVACYPEKHPEAPSLKTDIDYLRTKIQAGADSCITQYFFNPDAFVHFIVQCQAAGIERPVIPGLMPISNYQKLLSFSDKCGAEIPRWLKARLEDLQDDAEGLREFGAEVVALLSARLLEQDAPGIHFYTLNLARPSQAILNRLFST